MKYVVELKSAIDTMAAISRYLEDHRLEGEEWTASIRLRDGKFTIWFQVECRVQSNLKKTNSKIIDARLPIDFAYLEVNNALRELRG